MTSGTRKTWDNARLTCLAMAWPVMGWSPVTMITLMPALRHSATALGTEALKCSAILRDNSFECFLPWEGRSCS